MAAFLAVIITADRPQAPTQFTARSSPNIQYFRRLQEVSDVKMKPDAAPPVRDGGSALLLVPCGGESLSRDGR